MVAAPRHDHRTARVSLRSAKHRPQPRTPAMRRRIRTELAMRGFWQPDGKNPNPSHRHDNPNVILPKCSPIHSTSATHPAGRGSGDRSRVGCLQSHKETKSSRSRKRQSRIQSTHAAQVDRLSRPVTSLSQLGVGGPTRPEGHLALAFSRQGLEGRSYP